MLLKRNKDARQSQHAAEPLNGVFPLAPVSIKLKRGGPKARANGLADGTTVMSTSGDGAGIGARQHRIDRKAFKGRGAARELMKARQAVDKVHEDMRNLAEATKSIKGRTFYLALHARAATGQLSLRWRKAGATDTSHIPWDTLEEYFSKLPDELVHWYQTVNQVAISLNAQEKLNRSVLKYAAETAQINSPTNHPAPNITS